MAYNTRRGGGGGGYMTSSAASVGQRRPNQQQQQQQQLGNNFVSGGQLAQSNKPMGQMPPQQQAARQQQAQQKPQQQPPPNAAQRQQQIQQQQQNLRQQAQQFLSQQQQQQTPPPQLQQPPQQQLQQPAPQPLISEQPKTAFKVEDKPAVLVVPAAQPVVDNANGSDNTGGDSEEGSERRLKKNKPFWMRKDGKINKKERLRRRNQRLRKILQPKNALMVLNELIGSAPYNMTESADMYEGTVFRCTVLVDGQEHIGVGKSKPSAKTAAAEAALKHMVLSKLKNAQSFEPGSVTLTPAPTPAPADGAGATATDADGEIKMEIDGEDNLGGISWSHVACYALHKLLSSWDEGSNLAEKLARCVSAASVSMSSGSVAKTFEKTITNENFKPLLQLAQAASGGSITTPDKAKTFEKRPAKKLPDAAASMNPIMLLNQMHPNAVYEEISKTGNPPNVLFTVRCTVNGESFLGRGSTKKGARKMCAFASCRKVLGIQYTPAFLEEHGFTEDAVAFGVVAPMQVA